MAKSNIRVLLIEGNQVDRLAFERFVGDEALPYDYVVAESVSAARDILAAGSFDVVLTDYMFGDGTGVDLLEDIKNTPFIITTNRGDEKAAVRMMKAGAIGYLIKDPDGSYLQKLPILVENALSRHRDAEGLARYRERLEQLEEEHSSQLQKEMEERKRVEDQLEREKRYFREIFDATKDVIFVHDMHGTICDMNQSMCDLYGYTREEALSLSVEDLSSGEAPYSQSSAKQWVRRAIEEGPQQFDWQARRKDGELFWVEVTLRASKVSGKSRVVAVVRDITERKQAEQRLRLTQNTIDSCSTPIFWHRSDGSTMYVNEAGCRHLGYAIDELLTLSVADIDADWPADYWPRGWQKIKEVGVMTFESRHRHKNGHIFPVEVTTNYIDCGGEEYVLTFVTDIDKRKQVEEELRDSERKLHAIFDHHYQLTGLLDPEGRLLAANKTALDFTGSTESEVIGRYFWEGPWWNRAQESELRHAIQRAAGGEFVRFETDHPAADGEIRNIDFSLSPVRDDDGHVVYVVPEGRDITDIKRAEKELRIAHEELEHRVEERTAELAVSNQRLQEEIVERGRTEETLRQHRAELEEANEELEAFSYSVSHDLRAPLRHVHGYLQMLDDACKDTLDENSRRYMGVIQASAKKMDQLINDLLTLSRLGRVPLKRQDVDCEEVVREVLEELTASSDMAGAQCEIRPLPLARADAKLLRQVWANLLGNAMKYSSTRPEPQILVDSYKVGRRIWYRVQDNGVGFDPRYSDKLFGAFQRLHREDEFPGTGVGLAVVQRIVRKHGGEIIGKGAIDEGATFEFTMGA